MHDENVILRFYRSESKLPDRKGSPWGCKHENSLIYPRAKTSLWWWDKGVFLILLSLSKFKFVSGENPLYWSYLHSKKLILQYQASWFYCFPSSGVILDGKIFYHKNGNFHTSSFCQTYCIGNNWKRSQLSTVPLWRLNDLARGKWEERELKEDY